MRNIFLVLTLFILGSCTFNETYMVELATVDVSSNKEENLIIANGINYFKYDQEIPEHKDFLVNEIKKGQVEIKIKEEGNNYKVNLFCSKKFNENKALVETFKNKALENVEFHRKHKKLIEDKWRIAESSCLSLDHDKFEGFWKHAGEHFSKSTPKEEFKQSIADRTKMNEVGGKRIKLFSSYYPPTNQFNTQMIVLCFTFEKKPNAFEQVTYVKENDEWNMSGYSLGSR